MSIVDTLIKQIGAVMRPTREAKPVLDDAPPEADLLPAALFEDAPALEVFRQRAPGYRDWRQFANHGVFLDALNVYLDPAGAQTIAGARFNFAAWALAHIPDDAYPGWEEQIGP